MAETTERILFLDIDGVMIPGWMYLFNREAGLELNMDNRAFRILDKLYNETGCRLVFNTTHNLGINRIIERFKLSNFEVGKQIHEKYSTRYPHIDCRLSSIQLWLTNNGTKDTKWAALDDAKIDHENAYSITPGNGIGLEEYNHCLTCFGMKPFNVLF